MFALRREAECGNRLSVRRFAGVRSDLFYQFWCKTYKKLQRGLSPQLYEYKYGKLQEFVVQYDAGFTNLYFGDENHICIGEYMSYGW